MAVAQLWEEFTVPLRQIYQGDCSFDKILFEKTDALLYRHQQDLPILAPLDWPLRLKIALDIAAGMTFAHSLDPPLIHRDLKTQNVFLCVSLADRPSPYQPGPPVKVADFGLSDRMFGTTLRAVEQSKMGSINPTWAAPEILDHQEYSLKADVYSMGIMLWELLTRETPFQQELKGNCRFDDQAAIIQHVIEGGRLTIPPDCPAEYEALICSCWHHNPEARPSFAQIHQRLAALAKKLAPQLDTQLPAGSVPVNPFSESLPSLPSKPLKDCAIAKQWKCHPPLPQAMPAPTEITDRCASCHRRLPPKEANVSCKRCTKICCLQCIPAAARSLHRTASLSRKLLPDRLLGQRYQIDISIKAGRNLVAMDKGGTSDPYVVCQVDSQQKKTKVIEKTLNPTWNQVLTFHCVAPPEQLLFYVWDQDRFSFDDRMGNQAIAAQLFPFLHRVSLHSTENKMNTRNLGVCFGPSLLRPFEQVQVLNEHPPAPAVMETLLQLTPLREANKLSKRFNLIPFFHFRAQLDLLNIP